MSSGICNCRSSVKPAQSQKGLIDHCCVDLIATIPLDRFWPKKVPGSLVNLLAIPIEPTASSIAITTVVSMYLQAPGQAKKRRTNSNAADPLFV